MLKPGGSFAAEESDIGRGTVLESTANKSVCIPWEFLSGAPLHQSPGRGRQLLE
jgi:hypothetical protein